MKFLIETLIEIIAVVILWKILVFAWAVAPQVTQVTKDGGIVITIKRDCR